MKKRISLVLFVWVVVGAANGITHARPCAPDFTHTHPEKVFLDSLNKHIPKLMSNLELSWDEILDELDTIASVSLKRFGKSSLSYAHILHKKGVVYYNKGIDGDINAFSIAIYFYEKAIRIRMPFGEKHHLTVKREIINGYGNIGSCYKELQDPYMALEYLHKALRFADQFKPRDSIQHLTFQLNTITARTYAEIGDYDNALQYYNAVLQNFSRIKDDHTENKYLVWQLRALIESGGIQANYLDEAGSAILNLITAERILLSKENNKGEVLLANTYHNLGIAYDLSNDFDKSIAYYKKAIAISKKIKNNISLAHNYLNIGVCYNRKNLLDSAIHFIQQAEPLYLSMESKHDLAYVYDNLGDIEFKRGHFENSLMLDNKAMESLVAEFKPENAHANPILHENTIIHDKPGLLISLTSKANTLYHLYQHKKSVAYIKSAYNTFSLADELIGIMRAEFIVDASKKSLAKQAKAIYEQAINTCWELYRLYKDEIYLSQAFKYSEKSRAIILLDAVRKTKANFNLNVTLTEREKNYRIKINYFEKQLALQNKSGSSYSLLDSLLLYRRKHMQALADIRKQYPEYYTFIYDQNTIDIKKVKELLSPEQSLIEYFIGDSTLFIFTCSRDTSVFLKAKFPVDLPLWVKEFTESINTQTHQFITPSYSLYEHLILPIKEIIHAHPQLTIIPDGVLGIVPFEILTTRKPIGKRIYFPTYNDYLIIDHPISYSFSASALWNTHHFNKASNRKTYVGIAPRFNKEFSIKDNYFDQLAWNADEVAAARNILGGRAITTTTASKQAFLTMAPSYNIIHLATHAQANDRDGDLSFIAFGATPDDLIYAKDIYSLQLQADMVVLSACQAARGSFLSGEGFISLARGFLYAGASSVVTSLWNVKEESNKDIIIYFYENIKKGIPKDKALQQAKLRFLKTVTRENQEQAHPFYWAPMICIGDMAPYDTPVASPWNLPALLLLCALGYFLFSKKKNVQ